MREVSEMLYKYFTSSEVFKKEMEEKLFPIYASEAKEFPFAVYNIGEVPYLTKDARSFPITLSLCYQPESYLSAIDFADKMKELVEEMDNAEWMSSQTVFDDESQYMYVNINFNVIQ
ncbi:hypothetical protein AV926_04915 [Myroides marinus]|uniref:DUF3168 domain-containing protein n=1 Tax=Myroides marinus TaxID=703342 RepID=A0A164A2V1_9FLAO|nr:hypothetical protein [Myroides marinus]KZE82893.1 hypothetical protein AV926_04915 [Myroides marinus]